jgi:hypothetical protein
MIITKTIITKRIAVFSQAGGTGGLACPDFQP